MTDEKKTAANAGDTSGKGGDNRESRENQKSDKKTIRLDQLLKLKGAADSGGQAKAMVQAGEVKVNGEVDTRRGRKLHVGDVVEARGRKLTVDASLVSSEPAED